MVIHFHWSHSDGIRERASEDALDWTRDKSNTKLLIPQCVRDGWSAKSPRKLSASSSSSSRFLEHYWFLRLSSYQFIPEVELFTFPNPCVKVPWRASHYQRYTSPPRMNRGLHEAVSDIMRAKSRRNTFVSCRCNEICGAQIRNNGIMPIGHLSFTGAGVGGSEFGYRVFHPLVISDKYSSWSLPQLPRSEFNEQVNASNTGGKCAPQHITRGSDRNRNKPK